MFENNAEVDFGDDFTLNFEKVDREVKNKRPIELVEKETSNQKIFQLSKNVVKRKFPGPAGILPDRKDYNSSWEVPNTKDHEEIPYSQMSLSVFQSSPWLDMSRDFEPLIDIYDIKWIKTNAALKKLLNQKAPFLAAVIKSIECFEGKNLIVKVVLKDMSGEIQGTIIHSLYEKYSSSLVPGSVLVLKQCGVLTSYSNNHYLTITSKSLVTIYSKNNDEMVVINVQEASCDSIMVELNQMRKSTRKKDLVGEKGNEAHSTQLQIKGSQEEVETWENALEGVDMDSFLEDF